MPRLMIVLMFASACVTPDDAPQGPDASETLDAEPVSTCCQLAPDDGAVRACVLSDEDAPPSGTCGVIVCPSGDGHRRINFCVP